MTSTARDELVSLASDADCVLEMVPPLGAFVPAGAPLFRVTGDLDRLPVDRVVGAISLGLERTLEQDVAYGMRMLVDMAERSLAESPFTDPTTAVQAIDRLHDCLRQLAVRDSPGRGCAMTQAGNVRLIVPVMDWDAYVHLAFDEIRLAGAQSPQVTRRLTAALADLETVAPPDRLPAIRHQQASLVSTVTDAVLDSDDVAFALVADRQGIGVKASANGIAPEPTSNGAARWTRGTKSLRTTLESLILVSDRGTETRQFQATVVARAGNASRCSSSAGVCAHRLGDWYSAICRFAAPRPRGSAKTTSKNSDTPRQRPLARRRYQRGPAPVRSDDAAPGRDTPPSPPVMKKRRWSSAGAHGRSRSTITVTTHLVHAQVARNRSSRARRRLCLFRLEVLSNPTRQIPSPSTCITVPDAAEKPNRSATH